MKKQSSSEKVSIRLTTQIGLSFTGCGGAGQAMRALMVPSPA